MMTFEDYKREVLMDARQAIEENVGWWESWDEAYDGLFVDDSVTGNGSGSYTFNAARARENVRGLLYDDEFMSEAEGAGIGVEVFGRGPEAVDVIARCLALGCVSGELEAAYEEARAGSE